MAISTSKFRKNLFSKCKKTLLNISKSRIIFLSDFSDPSVKRSFCKRCSVALTAVTAETLSSGESQGVIECSKCGFQKKYLINADERLWCQKDEEVVEVSINK